MGKKWLVIVDATQLFSFRERHCEHCQTRTLHKGTPEEKTIYYHQVLEAKLVLGDDMIMTVMMEQYISLPLALRKPPAIFCLFFALRKSLSEMLSSNGTEKSCRNKR